MNPEQTQALSALAQAFADLFIEAGDLLPLLFAAQQKSKPLPRCDMARFTAVAAALSFVEDGRPRFFTLAQVDNGKINFRQQEQLLWIANDVELCRGIGASVPEITRARRSFFGFGSGTTSAPDTALLNQYRYMLQRNTQNIAIRAAYLASYARFALEKATNGTPETVFSPHVEMAQQHFQSYQRDIERIAPALVDRPAAASLFESLSFPVTPLIIAQAEDENSDNLNGIPIKREQKAAWLDYLAKVQSEGLAKSA